MQTWALPYRDVFGIGARPYLGIHLTGPNGAEGTVWGLVDSGADRTSLPIGFASLMGYGPGDLEAVRLGVADGSTAQGFNARKPAAAHVVGLEALPFEIWPTFVTGNATPLWGRADFFRKFVVGFDETNQAFTLTV